MVIQETEKSWVLVLLQDLLGSVQEVHKHGVPFLPPLPPPIK